ncbi:hypothetical protein ACLMJK_002826 [Lecanora helva]
MSPLIEDSMVRSDKPYLEPIAICGMACRLPGDVDSDSSFWRMLVEKRSGQTPKVPKSRFNIDAHYHQSSDRPGSFNVAGGYFLDGQLEDFDPTFFNITPVEAQWLDPQQRKMLEVAYECLASAGVTLQAISGSNTAVYVGSFTSDYQQMSIRDPDFRHNYAATGVDPGIISNRIGNAFNLKGPSRDCDAAIVGGVNLIMTVDQHMNTAKLGILSPTSTCHTFDESADGYGRAEGVGALYVKRLEDALGDGDPIRGVIRSSAVNTNGKIDGMGITHPSVAGQEQVVRTAYHKANLDPGQTVYAELHGTGTPVGDPIEVKAVSRALNDNRPKDKPLLVGAVKPNIGHSEAASGIFAVMKAAMMTEAAVIPGVAFFKKLNPNIQEIEWNVKVHADTAAWPKDSAVRRASVSSFGYGGTNGHVIIESIGNLHPQYQHARARKDADYYRSSRRPFLLCFSAHDKKTLYQNIKAIAGVAQDYYIVDLAHTLNLHRTMFAHRAFAIAKEGQEAEAFASDAIRSGAALSKTQGIGFLFTGQGAQWAGMAKAALGQFPIFMDAIQKLDLVLGSINPKPTFKLMDLLLQNDTSVVSKIHEAEVSQPLCTAIQIALVDLFCQWNIIPTVSIGHSSGEIGAAYAAGLISAPEAILIAFCRGRAVAQNSTSGSMLAVGIGAEDVQEYLPSAAEDACIACENSPTSVTLSGTANAISKIRTELDSKGIFARELKTGKAYHSPHMAHVGAAYDIMLSEALSKLSEEDLLWRQTRSEMVSSVTGELISDDNLLPTYWSTNLRQRVLFNKAVHGLGAYSRFEHVNLIIEVGPHSALAGPFKQIRQHAGLGRCIYIPTLVRDKNDVHQLLSVAGSLFVVGFAIDLEEINIESPVHNGLRKQTAQNLLVDLPPYQWNYEKRYWAEPRASIEQRARIYPRHDVLGSRVSGLTRHIQVWRNMLRHRDVPWLMDHNLGGTAIFPAAGYLSMAIEALYQTHEAEAGAKTLESITLRDVDIKTALVIPDDTDGVETILSLQTPADRSRWYSFAIESLANGNWTLHCEGKISATHKSMEIDSIPVDESRLTQRGSGKRWYDAFARIGFYYGKAFQQLRSVRTDRSVQHATGDVAIRRSSGTMQGESRYFIHPSTVDACLQLVIISIHAGKHKQIPWGVVPTRIEEMSISKPQTTDTTIGHALAWTGDQKDREFNTHVRLVGDSGILLDIRSLTCITYDAAIPASSLERRTSMEPFSSVSWKPNIRTLKPNVFKQSEVGRVSDLEILGKMIELVSHRQHIRKVLLCGSPSRETVELVVNILPQTTALMIGTNDERKLRLPVAPKVRTTVKVLPDDPAEWMEAMDGPHDLTLVDYSNHQGSRLPESLVDLTEDGGWLLGFLQQFETRPRSSLNLERHFAMFKREFHRNGVNPEDRTVTILQPETCDSTFMSFTDGQDNVRIKTIQQFSPDRDFRVVIDDTRGTLLHLMLSDATTFEAIKMILTSGARALWLTQGVKQGRSSSAGMAEGLLRTIRSEHAAARVIYLDVDLDERPDVVSEAVSSTIEDADIKDSGFDTEFWLHEGSLHISRLYPNHNMNQKESQPQEQPLYSDLPLKAVVAQTEIVFEPQNHQSRLADDEIEIQILASGIQHYTSDQQLLVGGVILRIGCLVDQSLIGRRVISFSMEGLTTILHTSAYALIETDDKTPLELLLSSLLPLYPIVNLCLFRQGIAQGEFLVSLPSPRAFTVALIRLVTAMKWRLYILVNSLEDKQEYTSQLGLHPEQVLLAKHPAVIMKLIKQKCRESPSGAVDVIAHEFDEFAQEFWRHIPASCRLRVSGIPDETTPDPTPFTRGASFTSANSKASHASKSVAALLELLLQTLRTCLNVSPKYSDDSIKVIDIADAGEVLTQAERQSEASVVRFDYDNSRVKISPRSAPLTFSPDAIYLLVGCLGGLGRSLTRWMSEQGAKNFAFISRSGADKPEAARLIAALEGAGVKTQVFRTDASDERALRNITHTLNSGGRIGGVVHAASVFKDGMFEHMSHSSFQESINAKALSALSLHRATSQLDLDFFVMTSSISALLGNPGQSNYCAANSVLDALALERSANNLAATSLVLPMVFDVGVVAENDAIEISLARKGLYGIDEVEMLRGFEVAMSRTRSQNAKRLMDSQVIMGVEAKELATTIAGIENTDLYWYNDARFCHLKAAMSGEEGLTGDPNADSFDATVKDAQEEGVEAVLTVIGIHIAQRMSKVLMIPAEEFQLDGPSLGSYGLDSMIGAEMRTWIFKEFGLDYPFQKLLAPTLTFKALAHVIAEKMELI